MVAVLIWTCLCAKGLVSGIDIYVKKFKNRKYGSEVQLTRMDVRVNAALQDTTRTGTFQIAFPCHSNTNLFGNALILYVFHIFVQ